MASQADAFLIQARSDFRVFELLWAQDLNTYPECHALQHLQMATEKMSKAMLLTLDPERELMSHVAFREVVPILNRPDIARRLGYNQNPKAFRDLIDRRRSWFRSIEQLSPSVGTNPHGGGSEGPNVEYPWQARDINTRIVWYAPAEYDFDVSKDMRSRDGQHFLLVIRQLLERLPEIIQPA